MIHFSDMHPDDAMELMAEIDGSSRQDAISERYAGELDGLHDDPCPCPEEEEGCPWGELLERRASRSDEDMPF